MEGIAGGVLIGPYVWGAPLWLNEPPTDRLDGSFSVDFSYVVHFTRDALDPAGEVLAQAVDTTGPARLLAVVDSAVLAARPDLPSRLQAYADRHAEQLTLAGSVVVLPGGELLKEQHEHVTTILSAVHARGLDRHSYVLAIGGGALLDVAGYAAAIAHRGLRLIRMPTTVLAQADSGVGVKNGVNLFSTKNFIGTFSPPVAVINDRSFLTTLTDRDWRGGLSEAVKVAALGDADFFAVLEQLAPALIARDLDAMEIVIRRCAELHVAHIARGGDPFESKSARPLDFGHWSAHKLEQISEPRLPHGEAVAIGLALDCTYARLAGILPDDAWRRMIALLEQLSLPIDAPELDDPRLLDGLREFREHLGGTLTVSLIDAIGSGVDVHEIDHRLIHRAVQRLHAVAEQRG